MNIERKFLDFLTAEDLSDAEFKKLRGFVLSGRIDQFLSAAEHIRSVRSSILRDFVPKDEANEVYKRIREIIPDKKAYPGPTLFRALSKELEREIGESAPRMNLVSGIRWMLNRTDSGTILSAAERLSQRWKGEPPLEGWILSGKPK
jgi:hypothetical protein